MSSEYVGTPRHIRHPDMLFFWEIVLLVFAVALISSSLTYIGMTSEWYSTLSQASWTPPDWVFSLIWTIMYVIIAITGFLGIREDGRRYVVASLFVIGLILNVLWCFGFFYCQNSVAGFVLILALTMVIISQMSYCFSTMRSTPTGKAVASLLFFYVLWLIYTTTLSGYLVVEPSGE
jgi:tryptophan-rich sensory protein